MHIKKPSSAVLVCALVCNPTVNLLGRCMSFLFSYKVSPELSFIVVQHSFLLELNSWYTCQGLLLSIYFNLGYTVVCKICFSFSPFHLGFGFIIMSYLVKIAQVNPKDFFVWLEDILCYYSFFFWSCIKCFSSSLMILHPF